MSHRNAEADEVVRRYARRSSAGRDALYSRLNPEACLAFQDRQRALIDILSRHISAPLDELRILEVGCGAGLNLLELIGLGFNPENLAGNELLPQRAALARRNLPAACDVLEGDALTLKVDAESFDIVYQSTVFTSILDDDFQRQLAESMWRWVKPGGAVLWYDFVYNNPGNPDVRGVPLERVRELFPEGRMESKRVTLAPPIGRRACRVHPGLYSLLSAVPWLRTHVLCWIGKA